MSLYLGTTPIATNSSSRNIGEIVQSTIPLTDAGLHLLDGALINGSGSYADFVTYIAGLVSTYPDLFTTEANWQAAVTANGVCDKFVYTSGSPATVRLPKFGNKAYTSLPSTIQVLGNGKTLGLTNGTTTGGITTGASTNLYSNIYNKSVGTAPQNPYDNSLKGLGVVTSGESGIEAQLSDINTALNVYYYIVVANSTKTQIEVDIDEVMTDLNGKADVDLSNCTKPHIVETYISGTSWYRVYSDGWCEQGGYISALTTNYTQYNLLKQYKDTNYSIFSSYAGINGNTSSFSGRYSIPIKPYSTSKFITAMYGGTESCYWQACGYIS